MLEHKKHRLWLCMQECMLAFSCKPLVCYNCLWEKPSLDGPHDVMEILVKWSHIVSMDKSAYIVLKVLVRSKVSLMPAPCHVEIYSVADKSA